MVVRMLGHDVSWVQLIRGLLAPFVMVAEQRTLFTHPIDGNDLLISAAGEVHLWHDFLGEVPLPVLALGADVLIDTLVVQVAYPSIQAKVDGLKLPFMFTRQGRCHSHQCYIWVFGFHRHRHQDHLGLPEYLDNLHQAGHYHLGCL